MARQAGEAAVDPADLDDAAYLAERYGTVPEHVRKRRLIVVGVVIGVFALAWSAWIGVSNQDNVKAETVGFDLGDGTSATVTFDVTMPVGDTAVCTLRALNQRSVEVGLVDVKIEASTERTQRVRGRMPTSEPAVSAMVEECALSSSDD